MSKQLPNKQTNFNEWYTQIITKSELISYYDVSGCYILLPRSYGIWEKIQHFMNKQLMQLDIENVYFPMFVSKKSLEVEENHIEDFSPEVAWVTHSGSSEMKEPIAIRPTSETIIYPYFAKKIQSFLDLPLKYNQWTNVVRWEFKHPTPFLRTREFLWQEGHTAHTTKKEADKEVLDILNLYTTVYQDLLAVPVIKGYKSEKEKFAGADYTTTVEIILNERAIQGATSHSLGQNFAKICDITYEGEKKEMAPVDRVALQEKLAEANQLVSQYKQEMTLARNELKARKKTKKPIDEYKTKLKEIGMKFNQVKTTTYNIQEKLSNKAQKHHVWQNSWGLTTRTIGVMTIVHSDNAGLVLPPKIAPIQVVLVVIKPSKSVENKEVIFKMLQNTGQMIFEKLKKTGTIRIEYDRRNATPGWKYNYHELRGVPLRLELGLNDLEKNEITMVRRIDRETGGARISASLTQIEQTVKQTLNDIQLEMFESALQKQQSNIKTVTTWSEFTEAIQLGFTVLAPWCESTESEEWIKEQTKNIESVGGLKGAVKSLCIPFDQKIMSENQKCVTENGEKAKRWCLFGRSY